MTRPTALHRRLVIEELEPRIAPSTFDWVGFPSADAADGKLADVSGPAFDTPYVPTLLYILIPRDATEFDMDIFDGDAGVFGGPSQAYDLMATTTPFKYELTCDPSRDGSGTSVVVSKFSTEFTDSSWAPLVAGQPVHDEAKAPASYYTYCFQVTYTGDTDNDAFLNGYKVRVRSNSPTLPPQIAIQQASLVGAPINIMADPPRGSQNNTYDGEWDIYVNSCPSIDEMTFRDYDADFAADADNPGDPPDDCANEDYRISPTIRYQIFDPDGALIYENLDPSGNSEYESFIYAPPGGVPEGIYRWHWSGVDAANSFSVITDYCCYPQQVGTIGDSVWHDLFHSETHQVDGVQDAGEPGLAGVVVELYGGEGNDVPVDITTTDADGHYIFAGLAAGTYTVKIADVNFEPGGVLQSWYATPADWGDDQQDSDGNPTTHDVTVVLGEGEQNAHVDFGFFRTGIKLSKTGPDVVYFDDQADIDYNFTVTNTGDVVFDPACVYDPLINPAGDHEIESAVVWPGQAYQFQRTYTLNDQDTNSIEYLTNTATLVGHPKYPDGSYLPNETDADSWTVHLLDEEEDEDDYRRTGGAEQPQIVSSDSSSFGPPPPEADEPPVEDSLVYAPPEPDGTVWGEPVLLETLEPAYLESDEPAGITGSEYSPSLTDLASDTTEATVMESASLSEPIDDGTADAPISWWALNGSVSYGGAAQPELDALLWGDYVEVADLDPAYLGEIEGI